MHGSTNYRSDFSTDQQPIAATFPRMLEENSHFDIPISIPRNSPPRYSREQLINAQIVVVGENFLQLLRWNGIAWNLAFEL